MQITISVKQPGRKHALIDKRVIEITDLGVNPTLQEFILAVVSQQVDEYNSKPLEKNLLPFLTAEQVESQAATGKAGFGSIYNENRADVRKAQETALLAFKDGLFAVFADEEEIRQLTDKIPLNQETVITFIRLTFLAGSFW
ncbi:hypothetical protein [Chitinophaga sp. 212800010-3]|uniref:hypothetical protein n=1 Tax=unclassified Chitinophaga TaxID=2619133 RepID=UPI002DF1206A|nr:Nucleoid-associated protein [Chitinophaga sp. 212800010-3]